MSARDTADADGDDMSEVQHIGDLANDIVAAVERRRDFMLPAEARILGSKAMAHVAKRGAEMDMKDECVFACLASCAFFLGGAVGRREVAEFLRGLADDVEDLDD